VRRVGEPLKRVIKDEKNSNRVNGGERCGGEEGKQGRGGEKGRGGRWEA